MREIIAIILAAGKGTRMQSDLPKALHNLCGKPIIKHVIDTCRDAGIETIYIIAGHGLEQVRHVLGSFFNYVYQEKQLGTGHALMQLQNDLSEYLGDLLVLYGDCPLITAGSLKNLIEKHRISNAAATLMTGIFDETPPYGRIIRDDSGRVLRIVEEKDASPKVKAIKEVNTSPYCFKSEIVLPLLSKINNNNANQEYYLTDIVEILSDLGHLVETHQENDSGILLGINSRKDLSDAEKILKNAD